MLGLHLLVLLSATVSVACGRSSSGPASGGTGGKAIATTTGGTTGTRAAASGGIASGQGGGSGAATGGTTSLAAGGGTIPTASGGIAGAATVAATGGMLTVGTGGVSGGTGGRATGGSGGSATYPLEGGPCSVEGEQSSCATMGTNPCLQCMGQWLYCMGGKWRLTHCDPVMEPPPEPRPDASIIPAPDAAEAGKAVDMGSDSTGTIDTTSIDTFASVGEAGGTLRGYLVFGTELMAYEACGTTKLVWANLQGWEAGKELLPSLGPVCVPTDGGMAPCPGTIYVELLGTISADGQYGHLGKFSQQLTVIRYLAASLTGPADCPFLPPVYPN
jgi:hypothetical protein